MAGVSLPLAPRDPTADPRTRSFIDVLNALYNSLVTSGVIQMTGPGAFGLAHLLFTGNGAPAASLASVGDYYLDLNSGDLYRKD